MCGQEYVGRCHSNNDIFKFVINTHTISNAHNARDDHSIIFCLKIYFMQIPCLGPSYLLLTLSVISVIVPSVIYS